MVFDSVCVFFFPTEKRFKGKGGFKIKKLDDEVLRKSRVFFLGENEAVGALLL